MEKQKSTNYMPVSTIAPSVVSIAILLISLQLIKSVGNYAAAGVLPAALTFAWALQEALLLREVWRASKLRRIRHLVSGAIFLLCTAALLAGGATDKILNAVGLSFALVLMLGRVFAILEKRRARSIVPNILAILLILLFFFSLNMHFAVANFFSIFLALFRLIAQAFSQIRLPILKRIIRKTYAVEILFGMLVLILAVSIMLPGLEPEIETFSDALWYCFAIVTTIGFGDVNASTGIGRTLSVILGIYGIIVVSLITSIIVNFYSELKTDDESGQAAAEGGETETQEEETE